MWSVCVMVGIAVSLPYVQVHSERVYSVGVSYELSGCVSDVVNVLHALIDLASLAYACETVGLHSELSWCVCMQPAYT